MIAYNYSDAPAEAYMRFELPYEGIPEFQFAAIDFTLITPFPEEYTIDMPSRFVEFFSPSLDLLFSMTGPTWSLTLSGVHLFGDSLRQIPEPSVLALAIIGLAFLIRQRS